MIPIDIAVDPGDDALYVRGFSNLYRYSSDGQPTPTYAADPDFASPVGVSLNGGGLEVDPATGDLLYADTQSPFVRRIDSAGNLLASYPLAPIGGITASPGALAVGQSGDIYVVGTQDASVRHLLSGGSEQQPLPLPSGSVPVNVAADAQTGEVVVLVNIAGRYFLQGFSAAGAPTFLQRLLTGTFTQSAETPGGLAWDPASDRIYYTTDDGIVHTFVPRPAPGLDAPVASNLTPTSADLSVGIAPAGLTTARLEICPVSRAFRNCSNYVVSDDPANPVEPSNPWQRLPDHAGLSGAPTTIGDTATGLLPNTTYRLRAVAVNETGGTETTSETVTFQTATPPPEVATGPATAVTGSSAQLTGTIDTFGDQTTYHFEYGIDTAYGSRVPSQSEALAGNGRGPRAFGRPIAGLQPGTTYHYRLVATNSTGTTIGEDRTLTTLGAGEVAPGRGYEQVSPVDKDGAVIPGLTHNAASPDGSSMVISTSQPPSDANTTMIFQHFITHRGPNGWQQWKQADPPQNVARGLFETSTLGISDDFDHAFVVSNRDLAPGGVDGSTNFYVHDVASGEYTLMSTTTDPAAYQTLLSPQASAVYFVGGARDFSWVAFYSPTPLVSGVTGMAMYKWSQAAGLTLLSQMPGNAVPTAPVMPHATGVLTSRQMSADGEVAYFALAGQGVYRREDDQTVAVSVVAPGTSGGPPSGVVQAGLLDGVSPDGRYAVFRSQSKLTDDATDLTGQPSTNIYRYDDQEESLEYLATGADLTGRVHVVSEDTRTVAFEDPGHGLSVVRDGVVHAVDTGLAYNWVRISPNGRYIAYRKGTYGVNYGEAYFYDVESQELTCVSCPADGGPGGDLAYTHFDARSIGNRAPQVVTDNGMMFFDSPVRLIPGDHNGRRDVYAFQNGQLSLISPGNANYDAKFVDASNDGQDVFFTTDQGLVGQDTDQTTDMYDARVGGGFPSQSPPASCVGEACRGAVPSLPALPNVGSLARLGIGKNASVSVRRRGAVTGVAAFLKVRVSGAGRIQVSGAGVRRSLVDAKGAGSYRVAVRLAKGSRLKLAREHRVTVLVTVRFASADGDSSSTQVPVTFKSKEGR